MAWLSNPKDRHSDCPRAYLKAPYSISSCWLCWVITLEAHNSLHSSLDQLQSFFYSKRIQSRQTYRSSPVLGQNSTFKCGVCCL